MAYRDLRDFIQQLEARGELRRIALPVDPKLEMTELCDRVLKAGGRFQIADIVVHKAVGQDAKDDIDLWSG